MKVRILETPIVERERAQHLSVGSIHDVVASRLKPYAHAEWPHARSENVVYNQGRGFVRLVDVKLPSGELVTLFPHEYAELAVMPEGANDDEAARQTVSKRIASAIVEFMAQHKGKRFHAEELRRYVKGKCGEVAPGSPDRILRDLRQGGEIAYRCVSKAESMYEAL